MSEEKTLNGGHGDGLAVGALDLVLLVVAVVGLVLLILRCRGRGKKDVVRNVGVPIS